MGKRGDHAQVTDLVMIIWVRRTELPHQRSQWQLMTASCRFTGFTELPATSTTKGGAGEWGTMGEGSKGSGAGHATSTGILDLMSKICCRSGQKCVLWGVNSFYASWEQRLQEYWHTRNDTPSINPGPRNRAEESSHYVTKGEVRGPRMHTSWRILDMCGHRYQWQQKYDSNDRVEMNWTPVCSSTLAWI